MTRAGAGVLAAAALLAAAAPAAAQPSRGDVRCLVASTAVLDAKRAPQAAPPVAQSPSMQTLAFIIALYFIGKVDGQPDPGDLKTAMAQEKGALASDAVMAELERCGGEVNAKAAQVQSVARSLRDPPVPGAAPPP